MKKEKDLNFTKEELKQALNFSYTEEELKEVERANEEMLNNKIKALKELGYNIKE